MKHWIIYSLLAFVFASLSFAGEDKWTARVQSGEEAMAKRQYAEAEKAFREALSAAAEKFGEKDARFSGSLLFLAQACDAESKQDEAEEFAKRAADAMDKALKAYHPQKAEEQLYQADVASALFDKSGDIFAAHHKYPDAEFLYKRVIEIRGSTAKEKHKPANNEDFLRLLAQEMTDTQGKLAAADEKLGNLYFSENLFSEAATMYETARKIRESDTKGDKRFLAQTTTNLATCYVRQNKYDQAEPLYKRALALFEEANWIETPEALPTIQYYALLLKKTGRDEAANEMLERAATIKKKLEQSPR